MDTTVRGIGAVVVAELRAAGYMESTVGQYAKTIKALTEFALGREYSTGLGAEFASMTTSVRTGRFSPQRRFDYRRLVTVFDSYVQTGRVDLAVRGRGGGGPRPESSDFVALDAAWQAAGSQYTAIHFTESLMLAGLKPSIGTVGDALDNGLAETTIGLYKTECIRKGSPFRSGPIRTNADIEHITCTWVSWYNSVRLMHRLGRRPPTEAEAEYYARVHASNHVEQQ